MKIFKNLEAKGLVGKLEKSPLLSLNLLQRRRISQAEWSTLTEDEREEWKTFDVSLVHHVDNLAELTNDVRVLGRLEYQPALPLFAKLWLESGLQAVRIAAGHALITIDTPEARKPLLEVLDEADTLSVTMAVRALLADNPDTAFDRCAPYFDSVRRAQPGGEIIPKVILETFAPTSFVGGTTPQWTEQRAPEWLKQDERWIERCVELRSDRELGQAARAVLKHADPQKVHSTLDKAVGRDGLQGFKVKITPIGDLLARYQRGEHEQVWQALRSFDAIGGDLLEEARSVAEETMRRVAHNADLLAERLAERNWAPLRSPLRSKPAPNDHKIIQQMEEVVGAPLPISFRTFWTVVGGINFVWDYKLNIEPPDIGAGLNMHDLDPLKIDTPKDTIYLIEQWRNLTTSMRRELLDPFQLTLAPDVYHKSNISGGAPYGIELPFYGADPIFVNEKHDLPFTDYLRLCFRWAGFPLLERCPDSLDIRRFLKTMTADFEAF